VTYLYIPTNAHTYPVFVWPNRNTTSLSTSFLLFLFFERRAHALPSVSRSGVKARYEGSRKG